MSVNVTIGMQLTVKETLTVDVPAATAPTITHNGFDEAITLNSGTTPPATLVAALVMTLISGAKTLDLTNLLGTNGGTVSGNGLQVRAIKIQAPSGNANNIVVVPGASNGLNLFGASSSLTMYPGSSMEMQFATSGPVIGSGAKTLDFSGTGAQTLNIIVVFG